MQFTQFTFTLQMDANGASSSSRTLNRTRCESRSDWMWLTRTSASSWARSFVAACNDSLMSTGCTWIPLTLRSARILHCSARYLAHSPWCSTLQAHRSSRPLCCAGQAWSRPQPIQSKLSIRIAACNAPMVRSCNYQRLGTAHLGGVESRRWKHTGKCGLDSNLN